MHNSYGILIAAQDGSTLQPLIARGQFGPVDLLPGGHPLLPYLATHSYDLLVAEVAGLPPVPEIVAAAPEMALLLLAANHERQQAVNGLRQGAADYILRPCDPTELTLKVERILGQSLPMAKLWTLYQAGQEISHTVQPAEMVEIVRVTVTQFTEADLVRIYLPDKNGQLTRPEALPPSSLEKILLKLAQQVVLKQKSIEAEAAPALRAAWAFPLVSRDKLIGVLALGHKTRPFSAGQRRWLAVFCHHAALAMENVQLFQSLSSAYIDLAQGREKLLQSQDTLRALFEGITDGLYILNQDLTIHLLNQVEAARQGYRPAELVGKSYLEFPWVRETSALLDQIRASLQTGHETTWISPQHDTTPEFIRDREFRIYPIRNRLAQIEQVIVFAQDVSERRRWQASLFRSANLATVGQLAGSVAHQINNPLTITMTNSQLILMEAPSGGEVYELAGDILKAGQRIQNIVQNLLDFSNQETYSFTEADLIETIEGALSLVIRPLKKAKIEVTRAYGISPTLSASVSHLKLVWMNLFLNARDAMLNYALQPQLTIATTAVSAREVKVEISDNGRGLTRGELKQLFNPFFTTKPSGQALGLGLYLAHTIIERHRGRIRAFSEPGRATTFEVVLPLDHPGEG